MNRKLVRLVVFALAAVGVVLFVGCTSEGGGGDGDDSPIPIGSVWGYLDVSADGDPAALDDGDILTLIQVQTAADWYMLPGVYESGDYTAYVEFKGTYGLTADTWTLTLTHLRSVIYGYNDWLDESYWLAGGGNYDAALNTLYSLYWDDWAGDPTVAVPYVLSGDEQTLYLEIGGDVIPFERA